MRSGEARAELTHDGELLTLQLREPCATGLWLEARTSTARLVSPDNNPGFLSLLRIASGRKAEGEKEKREKQRQLLSF